MGPCWVPEQDREILLCIFSMGVTCDRQGCPEGVQEGAGIGVGTQEVPFRTHFLKLLTKDPTQQGQVESALTIDPGNNKTFKECNPQKAYTASCIVVKELKHIHATLRGKRDR